MSCKPGQRTPRGFTAVTSQGLQDTLARRLIGTADRVRDLYTAFGLRPYTFQLIKTRAAQGVRGRGPDEITFIRVIDPTPLVMDLSTVQEIVQPLGLDEVGAIRVEQISGVFTEDQLRGFDDDGNPPSPDEQIFFTVSFPLTGDQNFVRRFTLTTAPMYFADRFMWVLNLEKSHQDPARGGELR